MLFFKLMHSMQLLIFVSKHYGIIIHWSSSSFDFGRSSSDKYSLFLSHKKKSSFSLTSRSTKTVKINRVALASICRGVNIEKAWSKGLGELNVQWVVNANSEALVACNFHVCYMLMQAPKTCPGTEADLCNRLYSPCSCPFKIGGIAPVAQ